MGCRIGMAVLNVLTHGLSYEHHSITEPAILLGGGFVVGDDK
jgi:hypothetical protein